MEHIIPRRAHTPITKVTVGTDVQVGEQVSSLLFEWLARVWVEVTDKEQKWLLSSWSPAALCASCRQLLSLDIFSFSSYLAVCHQQLFILIWTVGRDPQEPFTTLFSRICGLCLTPVYSLRFLMLLGLPFLLGGNAPNPWSYLAKTVDAEECNAVSLVSS